MLNSEEFKEWRMVHPVPADWEGVDLALAKRSICVLPKHSSAHPTCEYRNRWLITWESKKVQGALINKYLWRLRET